ncbi:MAG: hypothetical protein NUV48_15210 [Peptococcaceae bacterium]|jgi:hypothetical protein|nr:hypothetical protein [Peptococcaceae bacterium]
MGTNREAIEIFRTIMLEAFPELKGIPYKVKGKVVKIYENGPYAVDVQVLDKDDLPKEDMPILPKVEAPALWSGSGIGIYCIPPVGSVVRLGFYYNDPGQPYIDAVLQEGQVGDHPLGLMVISASTEVKIIAPTTTVQGNLVVTGTINGV